MENLHGSEVQDGQSLVEQKSSIEHLIQGVVEMDRRGIDYTAFGDQGRAEMAGAFIKAIEEDRSLRV
jgi:hypothetical protein